MSLEVNKIKVPQLFLFPSGTGFFLQFLSASTPMKYMYQWTTEVAERRITWLSTYIPEAVSYAFSFPGLPQLTTKNDRQA